MWERDGAHAVSVKAEGQRWQPTTRISLDDKIAAGWRYADVSLTVPLPAPRQDTQALRAQWNAGYAAGRNAGYQEGRTAGRTLGYQEGYAAGERAGRASAPATRSSCDEQWIASHAAQLAQAEVASINARNDDIRRAREAGARFTAPIMSPNYAAIYNRHVRDLRARYC